MSCVCLYTPILSTVRTDTIPETRTMCTKRRFINQLHQMRREEAGQEAEKTTFVGSVKSTQGVRRRGGQERH
jgi:hypothetical protein